MFKCAVTINSGHNCYLNFSYICYIYKVCKIYSISTLLYFVTNVYIVNFCKSLFKKSKVFEKYADIYITKGNEKLR
ncbi:TPA: hypothetical protein CPT87_03925 [Candidatus Gastranaerophilales bacterium HUM_5]|nr:MAG TPA: hypothetical protein CPT87_03925 [Candidatus Gastranaerophilales bacterium HUM_5]DAB13999.1 MAG TPA: hypothetical protein CPU00_10400 [Candidatus Gastranaerophilales bacterium HUM_18]